MIRLSKRAWNNVIIFAMLIMIIMFNMTNNILTGDIGVQKTYSLLPEGAVLMTLEFGPEKIERIGRGWRTSSKQIIDEAELARITAQWQNAEMAPTDKFPTTNTLVVVAWLAGETQGRVYQLADHPQGLGIFIDNQYYVLQNQSFKQFVLPGVL